MYQKRRKKEKAEQRKKESNIKSTATTSNYSKNHHGSSNTSKPCQGSIHPNYPSENNYQFPDNPTNCPITSYSQGLQLWWQTYCSAIEFHTRQQNGYSHDKQEHQKMLLEKYAKEYETSSEEEDDAEEDLDSKQFHSEGLDIDVDDALEEEVDEEYMKFLEITHKHREELRLKRAAENI